MRQFRIKTRWGITKIKCQNVNLQFQVLEVLGIWSKVVRIAGTSAGALMAVLLCVGYSTFEIEMLFSRNIWKLVEGRLSNCHVI